MIYTFTAKPPSQFGHPITHVTLSTTAVAQLINAYLELGYNISVDQAPKTK